MLTENRCLICHGVTWCGFYCPQECEVLVLQIWCLTREQECHAEIAVVVAAIHNARNGWRDLPVRGAALSEGDRMETIMVHNYPYLCLCYTSRPANSVQGCLTLLLLHRLLLGIVNCVL
jgi:hypothetical protein